MHFQCTHHVHCECTPLSEGVSSLENTDVGERRKHGSLQAFRLLWLKGIMGINVFLSNFQLLQKLHFVFPEQLAAAKEGGKERSSAGKMGRDGDTQTRNLCSLPSVVTAHHNLFSGHHKQGIHFYVAQLRSALQRKQAVGV